MSDRDPGGPGGATAILSVRNLSVTYRTPAGPVTAVEDFNLDLHRGEVIGIIGESGSGKTTAIRAILGVLPPAAQIASGEIRFRGDLVFGQGRDRLASIRGSGVGMVFQSASASINPVFRIGYQLRETLRAHRRWTGASEGDLVRLLQGLGLREPQRVLRSYPHELSGGMLQRASIALAVAASPAVIIADECTSALDVSTQAEVIELLRSLTAEGRGMIYVTHDLLLASEICASLIVMSKARIVEVGATEDVLEAPRNAYTRSLLAAVPKWEPRGSPARSGP